MYYQGSQVLKTGKSDISISTPVGQRRSRDCIVCWNLGSAPVITVEDITPFMDARSQLGDYLDTDFGFVSVCVCAQRLDCSGVSQYLGQWTKLELHSSWMDFESIQSLRREPLHRRNQHVTGDGNIHAKTIC